MQCMAQPAERSASRASCVAMHACDAWRSRVSALPVQEESGDLKALACSALGVVVPPSSASGDWAAWPLMPAQARHTMQNAWLEAHVLESLGTRLSWDAAALHACSVASGVAAPAPAASADTAQAAPPGAQPAPAGADAHAGDAACSTSAGAISVATGVPPHEATRVAAQ